MEPKLIFVMGFSGTGKTSLSAQLAKRLNCCLIDKDVINDAFRRVHNGSDDLLEKYALSGTLLGKESDPYRTFIRLQTYSCMLDLAEQQLRLGNSVIVSAPYIRHIIEGYFEKFVMERFSNVTIKFIFNHGEPSLVRERIVTRGLARDAKRIASDVAWTEALIHEPIVPKELENLEHIKLDCAESVELNVEKALSYIN